MKERKWYIVNKDKKEYLDSNLFFSGNAPLMHSIDISPMTALFYLIYTSNRWNNLTNGGYRIELSDKIDVEGYVDISNIAIKLLCNDVPRYKSIYNNLKKVHRGINKLVKKGLCPYPATGTDFYMGKFYECLDCDEGWSICKNCIVKCHLDKGHNVKMNNGLVDHFYCDCGETECDLVENQIKTITL